MKKNLLFIFVCAFNTVLLHAQPVITAADRPVAGDIFNYQQVKSGGVLPASPGANQVWDYSGLVDSGSVRLDSFLSVGAVPNVSLFPGTNLVEHGAGLSENYNYYSSTSTGFDILGSFAPGDTSYFKPPLQFFNYPFTYGSFFADSSVLELHSTGFVNSATYLDSTFVIGYGTLQLPAGVTHTGVLQVRHEVTLKTFFVSTKITSISYWTPGIHAPLLTASNGVLSGAPVIEYLKNYIIIVPLKWLDISATVEGNRAILKWHTADEINTSFFTIEKSKDGFRFESVKDLSVSASSHSYSATDDRLEYGQTYYRIRQTDKDGKFSYSPVATVNYSNKLQVSITPNLIRNQYLNLSVNSVVAVKADVKIVSSDGKNQLARMMNLSAGNNQQQIDISALAKGIYLFELNTGSERQVIKFVKQ